MQPTGHIHQPLWKIDRHRSAENRQM